MLLAILGATSVLILEFNPFNSPPSGVYSSNPYAAAAIGNVNSFAGNSASTNAQPPANSSLLTSPPSGLNYQSNGYGHHRYRYGGDD